MRRAVVLLVVGIAALVVSTRVPVRAQSDATPLAFEAASIKPVPPENREGIDVKFLAGRFVATNVTLDLLIEQAYGIEPRELDGGPAWIRADRFDIVATTDGNVGRDRAMLMLQLLLADRFKLQIARETRTGTVFTLTTRDVHGLKPPAHPDEWPRVSTFREDTNGYLSYHYDGHNATMAGLAVRLAAQVHAPVIDQTGLTGNYDFRINWAYDSPSGGLEPDPDVPTIFTALQAMGFKLESTKGSVDVLVIDSVEHPTEN